MSKRNRIVSLLLIMALLLQAFQLPMRAEASPPLFKDDFDQGLGNWDLFGSTAWQIQGSGTSAILAGTTSETSPQRAVVKNAVFPYTSADYKLSFDAQGSRFRTMFCYSSGTSYYFFEFKSSKWVELWKYPNASAAVQVGSSVDISTALPGFSLADQHHYRVEITGSKYQLVIDEVPVTTFTDSSLTSGSIGFSLKSTGTAETMTVDQVTVEPVPEPSHITILHTPATSVSYYTDLPVAFTLQGSGASVTASVYYAYGSDTAFQKLPAIGDGSGTYTAIINGTNRANAIRYYLAASDSSGGAARYPAAGYVTVPIEALAPYSNNFQNVAPNTAPPGWTTGGSAKVIALPDGNKVLNLNGSGSAKLNLPMYRNADNFVVKFKAKYERTSTAVQNTWRFRYRAVDDANNNALEWATHNSKYFLMRKTTLGGNFYVANYVKSLLGEWHDYELRVSGITHKLLIDGVETASGEDSDPLALKKGYFQWNVVGGINLMIDNFTIDPIPLPSVIDLQPSGNYAGIYSQSDHPGLALALDSGASAHDFTIDYSVRQADGDQAVVVTGTKSYSLAAYGLASDTLPFTPGLSAIGTYEVSAAFKMDGVPQPGMAKRMRIAIVSKAAPVSLPDLDNESKFGLNTHYALNWRDDIIDGARKLGARHHRSGIDWSSVDRNVKTPSGAAVYDFNEPDALLNKLNSYGFNQITVLGIDRNAYYQDGIINTASSLSALGDFVYHTVDRYKDRIRQWEMPNEPEIFSKPYVPEEFVQLQRTAYLSMKRADPDAMLLAGDHTSSVLSVLPEELALGSYSFADAYSFHPYVYNAMPDNNLTALLNGVKEQVNAYGGWKDYYLTEGGWPTATAGYPSVSEAVQRDYIVRAFLNYMMTDQVKAFEYYNYKNDGTDDRYYDIFWGMTDNDGRPKLAYTAVNQLMTPLDQARYIGTWDTGDPDVSVQLFLNNGVPVITAWRKVDHKDNPALHPTTSTIILPFAGTGASAKDINGAAYPLTASGSSTSLVVSGSPVYVTGAPASFILQAAGQLMAAKAQEASAKLEGLRSADNGALINSDKAALNVIVAQLAAATGQTMPAADLEQSIGDIYSLMIQLARQIKDGAVARAPGYVTLESLYNFAECVSVSLAYTKRGSNANNLNYASATQAAAAAFHTKTGADNVMPVSASAVLRMKRYGRLAEAAHARGDYADSYAYNVLAREFAGAVDAMIASEPVQFVGIRASVVPTQTNGEAGHTNALTLSLVNDTNVSHEVTVNLKLPQGWSVPQTSPATAVFTLPANSSMNEAYPLVVPENTVKGRYTIEFEVKNGGTVLETKQVQLTVEDGIGVRLLPVTKTIADLNVLSVEVTGTSSYAKTGEITVKGPDGTALSPVTTASFTGLAKGDKLRLDFHWTEHTAVPFNEYPVDLQITETASGKSIYHDSAVPLDFNLVQQANAVTVDGNLSDWQDAYPIHLRNKAQNASGFHDPDNLEATAYAKWSATGLYFAVAVKDNIHKQSENAANMWKNDSVQVSLDPLHNREAPYGPDDVEWGFALADDGSLLVHIFSSTAPNPNGDISGQVPFAAIRDEGNHMTRYEFQIPASYVHDLYPATGGLTGFNIAVNDADLQNGRDDFIQWTQGTADSKNTALYDTFTFVSTSPSSP